VRTVVMMSDLENSGHAKKIENYAAQARKHIAHSVLFLLLSLLYSLTHTPLALSKYFY
jgi:hypothetical protein